jgi:hypothetical protein
LAFVEAGVEAAAVEELGVGAVVDEAALVEHKDQVGREDRGEAVGAAP